MKEIEHEHEYEYRPPRRTEYEKAGNQRLPSEIPKQPRAIGDNGSTLAETTLRAIGDNGSTLAETTLRAIEDNGSTLPKRLAEPLGTMALHWPKRLSEPLGTMALHWPQKIDQVSIPESGLAGLACFSSVSFFSRQGFLAS